VGAPFSPRRIESIIGVGNQTVRPSDLSILKKGEKTKKGFGRHFSLTRQG